MQFKTSIFGAVTALLSAVPTASAAGTGTGFITIFNQTNVSGQSIPININNGELSFCEQLQPIFKGPFSIHSYQLFQAAVLFYTDANCAGKPTVVSVWLYPDCFTRCWTDTSYRAYHLCSRTMSTSRTSSRSRSSTMRKEDRIFVYFAIYAAVSQSFEV